MKTHLYYNHRIKKVVIGTATQYQLIGAIYFSTTEIAQNAIKEIVEPFMKAHPDFKW